MQSGANVKFLESSKKNIISGASYSLELANVDGPLSANPTKWSNTLTQFVGNLPSNCLSVFDHFVGLALKGLTHLSLVPHAKQWIGFYKCNSRLKCVNLTLSIRDKFKLYFLQVCYHIQRV